MNQIMQFFLISCSVRMGYRHAYSHAHSGKEAQNQGNQKTSRADGCRRVRAQKPSHKNQIDGIIQLLNQAAPQKRQRK